jgi:hypothetical protein
VVNEVVPSPVAAVIEQEVPKVIETVKPSPIYTQPEPPVLSRAAESEMTPAAPVQSQAAPAPEVPVTPAADEVLSFDTSNTPNTSVGGFSLGLSTDYQKTDLNQRYASQQEGDKQGMSMNDRLKKDAATTISAKLGKGDSLNDLIDLNKSFLFRNDLFAGNVEKYQQVIKQIDMFRSHEEALFFLEQIRSSLQINERNKAAWDLFLKTVKLKFQ